MKRVSLLLFVLLSLLLTGCHQEAPVRETTAPETEAVAAAIPETTEETAPVTEVSTEAQPEHFLLTFAGDCTLGASPANYYAGCGFIKTIGDDYGHPFRNVIDYFENDEFTMVNLEGVLAEEGNPVPKKHNFRGPTAFVNILTENSVEAVTLANNHTMDYGPRAYETTLDTLENAGMPYVERDSSAIVTTKNGLRIGLYGCVYYKLDVEDMVSEIAQLQEAGADLIVVAPHWGIEKTYSPTAEQVQVGHAAIDAGADIVFGSHPHVLQPIEHYGDGVIFYSMGNFSFGGNTCPEDFDTALVQQEVIRSADGGVRLGELTIIPACVSSVPGLNNYQPTPYEPGSDGYNRVLEKLSGKIS